MRLFFIVLMFSVGCGEEHNSEVKKKNFFSLISEGKFDRAILIGEKLEKEFPKEDDIPAALGTLYHSLGRDSDAVNAILRAIKINPQKGEHHANLGFIFYKDGSCKRALPPFLKAIEYGGYKDECVLKYATGICLYVQKQEIKGGKLLVRFLQDCETNIDLSLYVQDAKEIIKRGKYEKEDQ